MTFLPIAHRELRVSARNRATRRWRILFAIGAVVIAGAVGFLASQSRGIFGAQAGVWIFGALKWLAFVVACLAGVFLTSDCLSEEKREGTLGLLFLTDLRGYDVAVGKLLATSLRTFYGLLAIFPVMALSFVLGGVPADEFWHSLVALCNTLFFSLALGMAISSISRDANRAMSATLATMVVFVVLLSQLDTPVFGRYTNTVPALLSPVYAFMHTTFGFRVNDFWLSVILVHLAGWVFLGGACWFAPRTWQDKGLGAKRKGFTLGNVFGKPGGRQLLEKNPIAWIIARDRWAANFARAALILTLGLLVFSIAVSWRNGLQGPAISPVTVTSTPAAVTTNGNTTTFTYSSSASTRVLKTTAFQIGSWCASFLSFALELWLAAHVSRFYIDGKKSGFLELLLVTPVRAPDIIRGQWLGLQRLFLVPMAAQLALTTGLGAMQIVAMRSTMAAARAAGTFSGSMETVQIVILIMGAVTWTVGLVAIVWFSIWMGVNSKNVNLAVLKTFCFVKALPWLAVSFASGILIFMMARGGGVSALWLISAIPQGLIVAINIGLIAFARIEARDALSSFSEDLAR